MRCAPFVAILVLGLAGCDKAVSGPPTVPAPVPSARGDSVVSASAPAASAPASETAASADLADGGAPLTDGGAGAAARFRSCHADTDCIAVDRVGCCHNGWKEAVASSQAAAYARSFKCPEANPICAMYIVRDDRVPRCSDRTGLCTMTEK
jgi:hypothetical protein